MRSSITTTILIVVVSLSAVELFGDSSPWSGTWITDRGILTLDATDAGVTGTLDKKEFQGRVAGPLIHFEAKSKKATETGALKLSPSKTEIGGTYATSRTKGNWIGWKQRSDSESGDAADFSGVWLSSSGTLVIEQDAEGAVEGTIGPEGWSSIDSGKVSGGRMNFKWTIRASKGSGWFEMSDDKKRLYGVMEHRGGKSAWIGIRPEGYEQNVEPVAGKIVRGVAESGMLYNLRMPNGWKAGDSVDAIVLLHGSNWTTSGMVGVTAKKWPTIAKQFAIIGIQGQNWLKSSGAEHRFNYTYINWVGRSTLGGFPYTDRESPYLVAKLLDEFKENYAVNRFFVGGHSQGGYLAYMMAMHFPEKIAGTFPMAGGLINQAEPSVFDDEELMKAQRETPMYILHGAKDNVVSPSMGQHAYRQFLSHEFPRVVIDQPNRGHPYDFLPVDQAVTWLDMMTTEDKAALLAFGKKQATMKNWRNVGMVLDRAKSMEGGKAFYKILKPYEAAAKKEGESLLKSIQANEDGTWIDRYLVWEEQFALTTDSKQTIEAFRVLRKEHDEPADELYNQARKDFRSNNRAGGYAKYEEIAKKYYASRHYLSVKNALAKR